MSLEGIVIKQMDDIKVGDVAWFSKTVTEADIMMFAQLSGDYAPQHVSAEFGKTMMYGCRIAHGMLTAGLICPVLTRLCGDGSTTYSQEIKFKSAVLLNDTVTVRGEVVELIPEENKVRIDVVCRKQGAGPEDRPLILAAFVQKLDVTELGGQG